MASQAVLRGPIAQGVRRILQRGGGPHYFVSPVPQAMATQSANVLHGASANSWSTRWFSDKTEGESKEESKKSETEEGEEPIEKTDEGKEGESGGELSKEDQLEAQVKELKDQLLRSLAEQDNTRRIAKHDVESARQFAIKSFAKSLLDVSDNLSRAMEAVPEEARSDKEGNPVLHTLYEGIEMTETGLLKAFEANGLVKYGEVGEEFDPNKHNALFEYPSPEQKAGSVGQIIKAGFMLNERVLRPAEVGVVKGE